MIPSRHIKSVSTFGFLCFVTTFIIVSTTSHTAAFVVSVNHGRVDHISKVQHVFQTRRSRPSWQPLRQSLKSNLEQGPYRRIATNSFLKRTVKTASKQVKRSLTVSILRVVSAVFLLSTIVVPRKAIASMAKNAISSAAVASTGTSSNGVIPISIPKLLLSMAPLLAVVGLASRTMGLKLGQTIVTSATRTLFQLGILGAILRPIFQMQNIWLVLGHCLFMMLLAVQVACGKSNYIFPGQFDSILTSILVSVSGTALFAFGVIIKPQPLWNPQYVIPMVGMLLGNSLNGMALAMNTLCRGLMEQGREIELYQSFGANPREAMSRLIKDSIRAGTLPVLNNMAVIGLVSIPGMMTGQILGGSPVGQAARYQAMVMYFIALATFGAIILQVRAISNIGLNPQTQLLQTDQFEKMPENGVSFWSLVKSSMLISLLTNRALIVPSATIASHHVEKEYTQQIHVQQLKQTELGVFANDDSCEKDEGSANRGVCGKTLVRSSLLEMVGLTRSIANGNNGESNTLFQDLSFKLNDSGGEIYLVSGPSGSGKSQLLRSIGLLSPLTSGSILLDGRNQTLMSPSDWRRQVRYVTQSKVEIPGTPREFIHKVTQFESWKHSREAIDEESMVETVSSLLYRWGLAGNVLDQEWSTLSGGEAQRTILAIALASNPRVLLLDESTSALDIESKLAVEQSVDNYASASGIHAIWVSHDPGIVERLSSGD